MKSTWSDDEARAFVARYAERGVNEDLALRVYTSRLLGSDPRLVLHGGGNTSVKSRARDVAGDEVEVLFVKGSGWDMAAIEPEGHPAVRLAPLLRLRTLPALSDEDMVNAFRTNLLDAGAPTPSVETLLHAFLPHTFIDHTHAVAVLALSDQGEGEALCRQTFGDDIAIVPYVMPGFALAVRAAEALEANPGVKGLILAKHGVFTFADTAREAYERMIELASRAEARLEAGRPARPAPKARPAPPAAEVAPIVRGALALPREAGRFDRWVLELRDGPNVRAFVDRPDLEKIAWRGVVTPDHTIRIKNAPLVAPACEDGDLGAFKAALAARAASYHAAYRDYFARNNAGQARPKTELDPAPRVVLVPGVGLFGLGKSAKGARIAADLAESTIATLAMAERVGAFEPLPESDLFDMEYWSLEQAKLGASKDGRLARHVVLITGGGGAIGAATARAFAAEGAELVVLDIDGEAARAAAEAASKTALALACDVTDPAAVRAAFDAAARTFGGVDIVVSNAGAAWRGAIGEGSDEDLRASFELNFFAHQSVAQNAVRVMLAQGTGGVLLFNASKQAVNPGPGFGAYGLPKAATLLLSRQYALEYGAAGIRANAVNADRIRSGLLDDAAIAARAAARGVSETDYMSGNLLNQEVTAEDVAQALVHLALQERTTAGVATVDGGNIAAALR